MLTRLRLGQPRTCCAQYSGCPVSCNPVPPQASQWGRTYKGISHGHLQSAASTWAYVTCSTAYRTSLLESCSNLLTTAASLSSVGRLSLRASKVLFCSLKIICFLWLILSRVGWYTRQKWRVLVRMIGFISTLATHFLFTTHLIQAIQRYRWFIYIPIHRFARTRILFPLVVS
jgi:hypothetical protein